MDNPTTNNPTNGVRPECRSAFRDAIREDSRQTTPSRGVTPRKKFAIEANVESRARMGKVCRNSRQAESKLGLPLREGRMKESSSLNNSQFL